MKEHKLSILIILLLIAQRGIGPALINKLTAALKLGKFHQHREKRPLLGLNLSHLDICNTSLCLTGFT
jgi:hypothetical protein